MSDIFLIFWVYQPSLLKMNTSLEAIHFHFQLRTAPGDSWDTPGTSHRWSTAHGPGHVDASLLKEVASVWGFP